MQGVLTSVSIPVMNFAAESQKPSGRYLYRWNQGHSVFFRTPYNCWV